jgi:hypothetical protein
LCAFALSVAFEPPVVLPSRTPKRNGAQPTLQTRCAVHSALNLFDVSRGSRQFYYSQRPPTTITAEVMHEHAHHLDAETVDLISNRDSASLPRVIRHGSLGVLRTRIDCVLVCASNFAHAEGEMKNIVANHLATPQSQVEPVAAYNPSELYVK